MRIEYIFLGVLSLLPLYYKYSLWLYIYQLKEYRTDRICDYLKSPEGKRILFHFWTYIELPLFLGAILVLFFPLFEIFIFHTLLYGLVLYNIFVFGKMGRKTLKRPKVTQRKKMIECSLGLIFGLIVFFLPVFSKYIYVMISAGILFAPLLVFLAIKATEPIVRLQKERIYKKAQKTLEKSPIIKIGITGSYGKSSVKEYLGALLGVNNTIIKTPENINTEIGVSQFIIKNIPDSQAKYFICEMGAYRIGEIQKLGEIVGHNHGFLTAVGTQHVGLFGSEENIEKGKTEIALSVQNKRGRLYVNADGSNMERIVASYLQGIEPVKYGISYRDGAYSKIIKISESGSSFELSYKAKKYVLETNLIGSHHVSNLTGVLAFCIDEGIDILSFGEALMNLPLPNHTLSVTKKENITLIDDSYNLSVESLKAGIEVLLFFPGKKILILDDILELGDIAEKTHEELGEYVGKEMKLYNIMYVGSNYRNSFMKGLEKTDYDTANILEDISEIGDETTILFEGRGTQKYLHKFT